MDLNTPWEKEDPNLSSTTSEASITTIKLLHENHRTDHLYLKQQRKAVSRGLGKRGRFDSPGWVWSLQSVGAACGMRRESRYKNGTRVPGARAKISAENPGDKCWGGNKVLQTSPLKITRGTSGPTIQRPDLLLQG